MRIQAMLNIEVGNTKSLKLYKLLILVIISLLGWLNMHQDISMYFSINYYISFTIFLFPIEWK